MTLLPGAGNGAPEQATVGRGARRSLLPQFLPDEPDAVFAARLAAAYLHVTRREMATQTQIARDCGLRTGQAHRALLWLERRGAVVSWRLPNVAGRPRIYAPKPRETK